MVGNVYKLNTACDKLGGMSRTSIYKLIRDGRLVAHKQGASTVVFEEDLEAYKKSLPLMKAAA
jgi:excisionase family DNA binding protein